MIRFLRYLLFPFSILYGMIMRCRNLCYTLGIFSSVGFDLPVIGIGNLSVGGAGKTPATEYLVNLLAGYKVAILSRGYGRKTKGFLVATPHCTAKDIGDEPLQYYHKFPHVTVAVCEDRVFGIRQLKDNHDIILLDDAYQHRAVKAGFYLLLFEFDKILKWQFMLPTGNLREPFSAYKRADAVLITKCPPLVNRLDQIAIYKKINLPVTKKVSFASIRYGQLTSLYQDKLPPETAIAVIFVLSGIANPKPLYRHLQSYAAEIIPFDYPDHHSFTLAELIRLKEVWHRHPAKEKIIVTTEKDSKRLLSDDIRDLLLNLPVFYLPIEMEPAPKDKFSFDKNILDYVASAKRIRKLPEA